MTSNKIPPYRIAIVRSEFNLTVTSNLYLGAIERYRKVCGDLDNFPTYTVAGAFEIPGVVSKLLKSSEEYDAIVTLGCVIKGETAHFEYISSSVTDSISKLSIEANIPIIYGILTTYDLEQALERSDPNKKNKGGEVMQAAIDTIRLYKKI